MNIARGASAHANVVNGMVSSVVIDDQGLGYAAAPNVFIAGAMDPISGLPAGSGATAVAIVSTGHVIDVQMQNMGSELYLGRFLTMQFAADQPVLCGLLEQRRVYHGWQ